MNVRVALLLMVTALYLQVWAGDQSFQREQRENNKTSPKSYLSPATKGEENRSPARYRKDPATMQTGIDYRVRNSRGPSADALPVIEISHSTLSSRSRDVNSDEIPMNSLWMFGNCDLPLPVGIAPGTYRVVGSHGEVRKVELGEEELDYHGITAMTSRDLYWVSEGKTRWYFVRVESKPEPLWMAADSTDRRNLLQSINALVSRVDWQATLKKMTTVLGGLNVTEGALPESGDELSRGWTRQHRLELRQRWNAHLRQFQMGERQASERDRRVK